ncbi:acetylxylan esterase [Streptococcus mitis]|uniref:acetylxylan esterase n=1 Tax=Streptococcus mitis TaxID=28037 RepID=UPI001C596D67|nr:acetylxylan esterase [Streptococcus mitis]MBW3454107.1 acetylxylan esterase [Streptococcus mitis]
MKNPDLLEEIKTYKGRDEVPEDFDAFWDEEVKKVSTLPVYQLEERDFHIPQVKFYELTFEGTNQGKVYARVVLPKSEEKVPLIFHFHGYMGRGWDWAAMLAFTVAGYGVVSMDVRGQSGYSQDGLRSPLGNTVKGHIIRGAVEGREYLFYKDVYLDIYQLVDIIASLPEVDEKHLSSYGASQGGALALVAAALNPRIQKTVAIYPFLSDFRRVLEIGNTSEAYDELFRYFKFHDPFHETEEEIMATLAYIDVKNLAHRIKGEVKMITGLDDDVCYPITQFAIYNRLTCDKVYRIMPEYAHEAMNVFVNDQVYNWLCGSEIPFKYVK